MPLTQEQIDEYRKLSKKDVSPGSFAEQILIGIVIIMVVVGIIVILIPVK